MNQPATGTFADNSRPLIDRVTDLIGQLTIAEKIALLHQHQSAVPRLGIAAFRTGTEALHGLAWLGPATVFPQAIGLASTWDRDLLRQVGAAVGDEVRGSHRKDPSGAGLNVWAPVVNPLRDPRWGRNEEGYSEDPGLTGVLATAYAGGLRGDHPVYLRTAPTLKHFLGYNNETDRDICSTMLGPRVLHEYELPAFRAPIVAGAAVAVMASYNLVNGRPAHVTGLIATQLRTWTTDEVLVVSDAGAPSLLAGRQAFYPDHVTSNAAALRAGMDSFTEIGSDNSVIVQRLTSAYEQGLITESDLDTAVRRILTIRFRLGEFDPPAANPYAQIPETVVNCPEHQALARQAARQAIVLLKNSDGILPLAGKPLRITDKPPRITGKPLRIAVIGPLADTVFPDWYSGTLPYQVSPYAAIAARIGAESTGYAEGVDRIALREASTNRYLTATADGGLRLLPMVPGGAAGSAAAGTTGSTTGSTGGGTPATPASTAAPASTASGFEVFDWGNGVFSLRASTGCTVSVNDTGQLVADHRLGPNGWVVRETFRLVELGNGAVALRHQATGKDIVVGAGDSLHLATTAATPVEPGTAGGTALGGSATAIVGGVAGSATQFVAELLVDGVAAAVAAARQAEVAVVVVGNHPMVNGRETEDRTDLALPPAQDALIRAVHAANPATILVLASSYPFGITWAQEHLPAVLWSAHGGQEFGNGLADVLFGATDPSGRLTQTWYRSAADLPDLFDYDIIGNDMTYLYFRGTPLYPFGHGLSYTSFEYRDLTMSEPTISATGETTVGVTVTNTGTRPGVDVVQLYTRQRRSRVKRPVRQLQGFQRVELVPGEQRRVQFSLPAQKLAGWDVTQGRFVVESAGHQVMLGHSATDIVLTRTLTVEGETIPPRDALTGHICATDYDGQAGTTIVARHLADGEAIEAGEAEAWLAFRDLDFQTGAATASLRVRWAPGQTRQNGQVGTEAVTLVLRLDNPVDGPVAGTTVVPVCDDRYTWIDVPVALSGTAGVQDLYVTFSTPGIGLSALAFGASA